MTDEKKSKGLPKFKKPMHINKEILRKSLDKSIDFSIEKSKAALKQVKPALKQVKPVGEKVFKESMEFSLELTEDLTGKFKDIKGKLKEERTRKRAKVYLSVIFVFLIIGGIAYHFIWNYLSMPGRYPIEKVEVMGTYQYVKSGDIQVALLPYVQKGLFGMPELEAERALEQIPGVQDASIWRVYPNKIRVVVREKAAIAILNNQLLAADGSMFPTNSNVPVTDLPILQGDPRFVKQMLVMLESLTPVFNETDLAVTGFGLLPNGDWQVEVNHQTWITLGKADLANRVANFLNIYPTLMKSAPAGQVPASIDLRYPHGLTVVWGSPS
jgi:cell division protein FtsQ